MPTDLGNYSENELVMNQCEYLWAFTKAFIHAVQAGVILNTNYGLDETTSLESLSVTPAWKDHWESYIQV